MRALYSTLFGIAVLAAARPARAVNPAWPNPSATRDQLALPQNWPDDPGYGYLQLGTCTSGPLMGQTVLRPTGGQWNLWGFYPPDTVDPCGDSTVQSWTLDETLNATERSTMNGTGMSVDVAWTMTTGDPRVLIAVHDSGAEWYNTDLVNKWYLNQGELPLPAARRRHRRAPPTTATATASSTCWTTPRARGHDQPTIATVTDPRITGYKCANNPDCHGDTNGNGILDPEDLIAIFSDGVDNDGNGFVDDICGWDFSGATTIPATTCSYGHGTGEASDSAAEANNGIGSAGVCPDCRVMPVRVGDSFVADSDHFAEGVFFSLSHGRQRDPGGAGRAQRHAADAAGHRRRLRPGRDRHRRRPPTRTACTTTTRATPSTPSSCTPSPTTTSPRTPARSSSSTTAATEAATWSSPLPATPAPRRPPARASGEAGLIYSAMLKYHPTTPPLTAAEVMQLMWMTSEDINVAGSDDSTNPRIPPVPAGTSGSAMGATTRRLHRRHQERTDPARGRRHLARAGSRPSTRCQNKSWHHRAGRRQPRPCYDFMVQVAPGLHPDPSAFTDRRHRHWRRPPPPTARWRPSTCPALFADPSAVSGDPQANAVTLMVTAVAHYGGAIGDVNGHVPQDLLRARRPRSLRRLPDLHRLSAVTPRPTWSTWTAAGTTRSSSPPTTAGCTPSRPTAASCPGWPVQVTPLPDVAAHPELPVLRGRRPGARAPRRRSG